MLVIRQLLLAPLTLALVLVCAPTAMAQEQQEQEVEAPTQTTIQKVDAPPQAAPTPTADPAVLPPGAVLDAQREQAEEVEQEEPRQPDPNPGIHAPTIGGLSGLFRTVTTDTGGRHIFRIAWHNQLFKGRGFLVGEMDDASGVDSRDDHSRYAGTISMSYTPIEFAELFFNISSMANNNQRPNEPNRLDQEVILALGDVAFGGKVQYPFTPYFGLGAEMGIHLLSSVGGVSLEGGATGFHIGMISSFDMEPLNKAPLRFHFNFGYMLDNSNDLVEFSDQYSLASIQVEKFSLGIMPSRLQLRFGMDLMLRRWTSIGITPIIELAADFATDESDKDFDNDRFVPSRLTPDEIDGVSTVWMTVGVRVNPVKGFNVALGTDIGLLDPGYGYGPPVIPWNLILGFSYAYDPNPPLKVVHQEKIKTVYKPPEPSEGKLRGRVINAQTLEPVEAAVVTFPGKDLTGLSTDPDGSFLTYPLPAGQNAVMIRHPDYLPGKVTAEITIGTETPLDIKLEPAPPKVGKVAGSVRDLKGNGVSATIAISGIENREVVSDPAGAFSVELKPGDYHFQVSAAGYLRKERTLEVEAGSQFNVDIILSPKPRRSLVRVTRRSIHIRRKVHFGTGTATILPDSQQLLDSVVDVLLTNPQITRLEIQGHTDNRGSAAVNTQLSQDRADSVRDYLIKNGIAPDRLIAKGYGSAKPKVPNLTPRNRARNRRVEFRILNQ